MKTNILLAVGLSSFLLASAQAPVKTALFSKGDNKAMAQPAFNEAGLQKIDLTRPWSDQKINGVDYGWYRIHITIPSSVKNVKDFSGYIHINLGQIDDADEVYLNGKLIGKSGRMPGDKGGYLSAWSVIRDYAVKASDKCIKWDADNVIAVRCYNGNDPGGMTVTGGVTISVPQIIDGVSLSYGKNKKGVETVILNNRYDSKVVGVLELEVVDNETGKVVSTSTQKVQTTAKKPANVAVANAVNGTFIRAKFTDNNSGKVLTSRSHPKYILTPAAPAAPRFNTAPVYGVRPGSPVHYRFGVSGERPMTFTSDNLPAGLKLDAQKGVLSGSIATRGDYTFTVKASNAKGTAEQKFTIKVGDKIALTPPMGWNSWNCWGLSVTQDRVVSSAQAIIDKGLADYGYAYINVDDGWEAPTRNDDGTIAVNEKFPSMADLGNWLHGEGLKFGIYSSPGDLTCGCYLGSLDHELQDAETYNSWGIDYLKYDWCGYHKKHAVEPDKNVVSSYIRPYMLMGEYLRRQPRDIFYSLCQYGMADVWKWGAMVDANSWRTTGDITDTWESLYDIGFNRQAGLAPYAAPGHWNDPDMLIVGKVGWSNSLRDSRLTPDEQYTHIALWSLLASDMLIGCDVAQMDEFAVNVLCNNEVLAVNQDIMGAQADRAVLDGDIQIWTRPLSDGTYAIGVFNVGTKDIHVDLAKYFGKLGINKLQSVRDLWRQKDLSTTDTNYFLPSHGVKFIKVKY